MTGPRGCLFGPGFIAVALIGGGIFAMSRWEALSGLGRAAAVILVILGTLALLPVLMLLGFKLYVDRMVNQLMKDGGTIIDANHTITVDEKIDDEHVIDAIGPRKDEHREKPLA